MYCPHFFFSDPIRIFAIAIGILRLWCDCLVVYSMTRVVCFLLFLHIINVLLCLPMVSSLLSTRTNLNPTWLSQGTVRRMTRQFASLNIAVVGGGASGIFSAIAAAENLNARAENSGADTVQVTVLEATNNTLSKVKISGGGRCNVLHDTSKPVGEILQGYPRGRKELIGIFHKRFTPSNARQWFESRGVQLKTEADGRMFPTSDSSQTIIDTLLSAAQKANVHIQYRFKVEQVAVLDPSSEVNVDSQEIHSTTNHQFCVSTKSRHSQNENSVSKSTPDMYFDAVILATGSMPAGYKMVQHLNHSFVPTVPSLFTLNSREEINHEHGLLHGLAGISVPYAEVSFRVPGQKKPLQKEEGPLLITHHGLSGPAILRLSAFGARELAKVKYQGILRINWAPHLGTVEDVMEELWKCTSLRPKKHVSNHCPLMLPGGETEGSAIPRRLWSSMVQRVGFSESQIWASASKKLVRKLAMDVCACDIEISGKSTYKDEFVTAGGVSLKEIDMQTMQSKKYPGLFFCGELVNVDGVTGGYNFLNCWSTGYIAGNSAADFMVQKLQQQQSLSAS